MKWDECYQGQRVKYIPQHANGDAAHPDCEMGIIKSYRDNYVMVRYEGTSNIKATRFNDLVPAE